VSSLEPLPDGELDLVVASLRADASDVASMSRVLLGSLAEALPPGMVVVERERSMRERLSGQEGRPVALTVDTGEHKLSLRQARGAVVGEVQQVVRGVVISRREVDLASWSRVLAEDLTRRAEQDSAAREALQRMLGA
jgi:hypothetical protein